MLGAVSELCPKDASNPSPGPSCSLLWRHTAPTRGGRLCSSVACGQYVARACHNVQMAELVFRNEASTEPRGLESLLEDLRSGGLDARILDDEGEPAAGTKGLLQPDAAVAVAGTAAALTFASRIAVAWLARQRDRSIVLERNGDRIVLTGASDDLQSKALEAWIGDSSNDAAN